jgi:hypothetical protein
MSRSSKPRTSLQRAPVGPLGRRKPADGPAPWLLRVESLELRSSQRKTPPVRREQPSLRGDVGASNLGPSQRDSLISRRAAATRVTLWCPDSGLRDTADLLREARGGLNSRRPPWARRRGEGWRSASAGRHPVHMATRSKRPASRGRTAETPRKGRRGPPLKSLARKRGCLGGRGHRGMHRRAACRKQHCSFVRSRGESGAGSLRWMQRAAPHRR